MYHELQIQDSCDPIYPVSMVCFRNITVNILYKGDNKKDDGGDYYYYNAKTIHYSIMVEHSPATLISV